MNKTHAFVFARGGSKGLPNKNILPIAGLPMLVHGIKIAAELADVDRVFVSTDSLEIASVAKTFGADVICRPSELASDTAPEWLAWQHAVKHVFEQYGPFDRFLSLPATAPLRNSQDIRNCLSALHEGVDMVITITPSNRSPWFNMVEADPSGNLRLLLEAGDIRRRQDAKKCYDIATVAYVTRPSFILEASSIWDGIVTGVEIPRERSIDIDDSYDYQIAKLLMEES